MLNKCTYVVLLIVSLHSLSILAFNYLAEVTGNNPHIISHLWVNDKLTIETAEFDAKRWSFNNYTLAEYNGVWIYSNSIEALNISANISFIPPGESCLILNSVQLFHTGRYVGYNDGNGKECSVNLTVYDVKLNEADVVLRTVSNTCKAYLRINDSVIPSDHGVDRAINLADFTVNQTNLSDTNDFEIINSSLSEIDNSTRIIVDIQYTLSQSNSVRNKSSSVDIGTLIGKPNVTKSGFSNNCKILLQHDHTKNVECVRNISYCLTTNGTSIACNFTSNIDQIELEYTSNLTSIDLEIQYDIIYGKKKV